MFFVKIYGMVCFLLPYPGPKYRHMSGGFQLQGWPPKNKAENKWVPAKMGVWVVWCLTGKNWKFPSIYSSTPIVEQVAMRCHHEMSPSSIAMLNHRIVFSLFLCGKNNAPTSPTGPTAEPLWRIWTIHDLRNYGYWRITPLVEPLKRRGRGYSYHEVFSNSLRNMEDFRGAGHKEATILERFLMGEL